MDIDLIRKIKSMNKQPVAFNPLYVKIGCTVKSAILLSQIVYWSSKRKEFYKTVQQWESETGLTGREQKSARDNLLKLGFVSEIKKGIPCRIHFTLNADVLFLKLSNHVGVTPNSDSSDCGGKLEHECESSSTKELHTVQTKAQNKLNKISGANTENTTENTTESKKTNTKNKKTSSDKFDFAGSLIGMGADTHLVRDYMLVRKRLSNTQTGCNILVKQINLAIAMNHEVVIDDLLKICIFKNWGSFSASWNWQQHLHICGKQSTEQSSLSGLSGRHSYRERVELRSQDNSLEDFLHEHNSGFSVDVTPRSNNVKQLR